MQMHGLEDLAITPLLPLGGHARLYCTATAATARDYLIVATSNRHVDRRFENLVYTVHFFR